jgi:hypothetical protein
MIIVGIIAIVLVIAILRACFATNRHARLAYDVLPVEAKQRVRQAQVARRLNKLAFFMFCAAICGLVWLTH